MAAVPFEASLQALVERHRTILKTPYYLIDEARLLQNLERLAWLRSRSGARAVLALKCFAAWSVFDLMRLHLDGTTASSPYEARLGAEKFGKEVHAYSVAFSDDDVDAVAPLATRVIFNSVSQLRRHGDRVRHLPLGLRLNPGVSYSHYDLADPGRRFSRLGEHDAARAYAAAQMLSGLMFHCNCENADVEALRRILATIGERFGPLLYDMEWVSLGGGIACTDDGYPLDALAELLAEFASRFRVQLYLEPGSAAVTGAGYLVTRVLDVVHNEIDVAIVDAGVEAHMLDLLTYGMTARLDGEVSSGPHRYMIAGRSCLAGDVFGTYSFPDELREGSLVVFSDAADYTMVKKNWFNGLPMPSIVVRRLDGRVELVKAFGYEDFVASLS